jgi:hypothetical protein
MLWLLAVAMGAATAAGMAAATVVATAAATAAAMAAAMAVGMAAAMVAATAVVETQAAAAKGVLRALGCRGAAHQVLGQQLDRARPIRRAKTLMVTGRHLLPAVPHAT